MATNSRKEWNRDYMKIRITGSGSTETADSIEEAIAIIADWYDYLSFDYPNVDLPTFNPDGKKIGDVDALYDEVRDWQDCIADACGIESNPDSEGDELFESASEQMGLYLNLEEIEDEEENEDIEKWEESE